MTDTRSSHASKAKSPIVLTLPGIFIVVRPDSQNVPLEIETTDDGMLILFKALQPWYLQPIITQYFIDNKSEIWLLFLIAHSKR